MVTILVSGVFALAGLARFRRSHNNPGWFIRTLLILSIAIGGLMTWTANLGGQIRHSEIRSTGRLPAASPDY